MVERSFGRWKNDIEGKLDNDGGIHGVSALAQHLGATLETAGWEVTTIPSRLTSTWRE